MAAGGYLAARAAFPKLGLGPASLRAMGPYVLGPAGMRSTTFDTRRASRQDHAVPHSPSLELKYQPIPLAYEDTVISVGPAGGAWSNVEDMARFVLLELGRGKTPEGKPVVSSANLERRWVPGARISKDQAYGLAMVVSRRAASASSATAAAPGLLHEHGLFARPRRGPREPHQQRRVLGRL